MLILHFGRVKNEKKSGDGWFENALGTEYLETDFSKKVIQEIDKSNVYDKNLIISPILGGIPPERISGGSKVLICLKYTSWVFSINSIGENCYSILSEIAEEKDIFMTCDRGMTLYNKGFHGKVKIDNLGIVVDNDKDLIRNLLEVEHNEGQV